METLSALLLAICKGDPLVTGGYIFTGYVMQSFSEIEFKHYDFNSRK